jgi:hypothetical protein
MTLTPAPHGNTTTEASELDRLIAATGNSYYHKPFAKFARDGRVSASWNWAASFFGVYWLYRRDMTVYSLVYLIAGLVVFAVTPPWLFAYLTISHVFQPGAEFTGDISYRLTYSAAAVLVFPCYANALYYGHLRRLLRRGKLGTDFISTGARKTGVMGYLAYIGLALMIVIIAAVFFPVHQDRKTRGNVDEILAFANESRETIGTYLAAHGKLPDGPLQVSPSRISKPSYVGEVRIEKGGVIRLVLTGPHWFAGPDLEGKSILLAPLLEAGKIHSWRCSSDIPDRGLPAWCRTKYQPPNQHEQTLQPRS